MHSLSLSDLARRFYYSRSFSVFYAAMILLNMAILIWAIRLEAAASPEDDAATPLMNPGLLVLEAVAVILLIFEIAVRVLHQRKKFWKRYWNRFDCMVGLLSLVSLAVLGFGGSTAAEEVEDIVVTTMRAIRYVAQSLRVVLLVKNHRARRQQGDEEQISFTALSLDDDDDDDDVDDDGGGGGGGRGGHGSGGGGGGRGTMLNFGIDDETISDDDFASERRDSTDMLLGSVEIFSGLGELSVGTTATTRTPSASDDFTDVVAIQPAGDVGDTSTDESAAAGRGEERNRREVEFVVPEGSSLAVDGT